MTWAKLDDKVHDDERSIAAKCEAMGLWVMALSYMGDHLTDGHITHERVQRIAGRRGPALAARLVEVGWWEQTPSGYRLISWENFLLSRSEVEANRLHKSELGRRGGVSKAAKAKDTALAPRQSDGVAKIPIPSRTNIDPNQIPEGGNAGEKAQEAEQPPLPGFDPPVPKGAALEAAIFAEYIAARPTKGRAPVLDEKRRAMIRARLADGFTADDLKAAARGIWKSPFHTTPEAIAKGFTGFEYVVRDAKGVERFRDLGKAPEPPSTPVVRTIEFPRGRIIAAVEAQEAARKAAAAAAAPPEEPEDDTPELSPEEVRALKDRRLAELRAMDLDRPNGAHDGR